MATGHITFPGVVAPIRMVAARTTGTEPDKAILWALPQPTSPDCSGMATLTYDFGGTTITWKNALCDKGNLQITTHGHIQIFVILDSRWRWAKHYISEVYNRVRDDGSIDPATQKTVAELVQILFAQIGVAVDVSLVTSTEYPEIVWDYANCADELSHLLQRCGYVVSLQLDDTARIYPIGTGATLPANDDVVTANLSIDPPEIPENLIAVAENTMVQSKLLMQPVGEDTDGSIKRTADLSYSPGFGSTGFDGCELDFFAYITDPVAQDCARRSVGRWFQVFCQGTGSLGFPDQSIDSGSVDYAPGEITVTSGWQLRPLSKDIIVAPNDVFGVPQKALAYVEGTFFNPSGNYKGALYGNTPDFTRVDQRDWDLDEERGIVMFKSSAFKKTGIGPNQTTFADVYLTCSYSIDNAVGVKDKLTKTRSLGGYGDDVRHVDGVQRTLICNYTPGTNTLISITDNKATVDASLDKYLDDAARQYGIGIANVITYRGIYAFATDGVNLQIRWDCANTLEHTPWATVVAQQAEVLPILSTSGERASTRDGRLRGDPTLERNRLFKESRKRVP